MSADQQWRARQAVDTAAWAPWAPGLDQHETLVRLRCVRLVLLRFGGPRVRACRDALLDAEMDPRAETLAAVAQAFDKLPSADRQPILAEMAKAAASPSR